MKSISEAKIKAGKQVDNVRNTLKQIEHRRQDIQEDLSEAFKPIVTAQEEVKQTIDEKQDKMLEQLQKNQKALTSGLEDLLMIQQLPDAKPQEASKLPLDYEPTMMKPKITSDVDKGFNLDEMKKLIEYNLYLPSQVLQDSIDGTLDIEEYDNNISKILQKLGTKKRALSKGSRKQTNKNRIDVITKDIKLIQKYRDRIKILPEGKKTIGTGYTLPKRNAYKISSGG